jgi:hypothetical protein
MLNQRKSVAVLSHHNICASYESSVFVPEVHFSEYIVGGNDLIASTLNVSLSKKKK